MSAWIDLIGSFIFGSLLALNVMRMNADMAAHSYKSSLTYIAQSSAATVSEIVSDDLRKAGIGVADTAFTLADTSQIRFLADLDADGTVDTLHYYTGGPSEAAQTLNPSDRVLYRVLNSDAPDEIRLGVTTFTLSYFGAAGDSLGLSPVLGDIRQVRVDLTTESRAQYDGVNYARAYMQLRIRPRNLTF